MNFGELLHPRGIQGAPVLAALEDSQCSTDLACGRHGFVALGEDEGNGSLVLALGADEEDCLFLALLTTAT